MTSSSTADDSWTRRCASSAWRADMMVRNEPVDRSVFVERARALAPRLKELAAEAEELRRLPDESHQKFVEHDLYRMYQPRQYGGFEMDYQLQVDVAAEIGRACGSSAWVVSILASHSWVHGMLGREA